MVKADLELECLGTHGQACLPGSGVPHDSLLVGHSLWSFAFITPSFARYSAIYFLLFFDAWAGTAGGGPGYGAATGGATPGTIYDPSQPVGSRWRQVADSLILRFYHSVATLTQNAEVLVTGSEATVDYRVQIYGRGGADVMTGSDEPDRLDGGRGFDIARGRGGNDTCKNAEKRSSC